MTLSIPIFHEQAEVEYNNSRRITTELASLITVQEMEYTMDELAIKKIKLGIKSKKENTCKNTMEHLKDNMFEKSKTKYRAGCIQLDHHVTHY